MYNLPDVYSTTSTVPSTANLQVVAACSVWLSVNTGYILMSPEPSTSTQNHEVCVDCTILQDEVTRNNQQIQCLQNQLSNDKQILNLTPNACQCIIFIYPKTECKYNYIIVTYQQVNSSKNPWTS
jgi:hypothetical protein